MRTFYVSARARLGFVLAGSSLASIGLYVGGVWGNYELEFAYMIWNLFLAWVALGISLLLERTINRKSWSSWPALILTVVWLLFLPNTFYMITDYIHVLEIPEAQLLNGVFMFSSFIFNGLLLGVISVYIVHRQLIKRLTTRAAWLITAFILLLSSFAMYMGRELRWNSWDVIASPSSLLFDVTDRLINAKEYPHMLSATSSFFILILSTYIVLWHMTRVARKQPEA